MSVNSGGNAKIAGIEAAKAKGEAETQKQEQQNQQQQQQSKAGPQGTGSSLGGNSKNVTFDKSGNTLVGGKITQFAGQNARDVYLGERGLGNTGQIINQDQFAKADFSNLENPSNATINQAGQSTSGNSSLVNKYESKNPLEVNWELSKNREAVQARAKFSYQFDKNQGGVKTNASEIFGDKYSQSKVSKGSQSIGSKIFTNQEPLVRGSTKEEQIKQSEAERAFSNIKSTTNKDYATGGKSSDNSVVTLGKAQRVFGNKTSFGWNDVSKDQLSRDSSNEKTMLKGRTPASDFGIPFGVKGGLTDKTNSGATFLSAKSDKSQQQTVAVSKPQPQTQDFNTFFADAQSKGATIDIFNAQGAKVGSVKADKQGRQTLESLGDVNGIYFREDRGPSTFDSKQSRAFADFISSHGKAGATLDLFAGDQKVGEVSGPNAYRDTISIQSKFGAISAKVEYSSTPEGKSLLDAVSKGAIITFSTPPNEKSVFPINERGSYIGMIYSGDKNAGKTLNDIVNKSPSGFAYQILYPKEEQKLLNDIKNNPAYYREQVSKNPNFFDTAYQSGKLQPNDIAQINNIFHNYDKEQNLVVKEQQKQTASYISNQEYPGNTFVIKDQSGKVIGTTSGQRSRYDFLKSEGYGTNSKTVGPYTSNSITPKYNGTFGEGFKAITEAKAEPKDFPGILSDILQSAKSTGASMVGLGLSALTYGKGAINDVNKPVTTNYNNFTKDVGYLATGGYSISGLFQGRIIQKDAPPLTPQSESIMASFPGPSANRGYVNAGAGVFTGVTLGLTAIGLKGASPVRLESIPLKVGLTESSPAFPLLTNVGKASAKPVSMSESLVFGFGPYSRELISKVPTGYKYGKLKPNDYFPEGYALRTQATRGEEFATGKSYPVSKLTSNEFQNYAEETGRSIPGTAKATKNFIELKQLADTSGEYTQYKKEIPTSNERITSQVGKTVLETNAKLYSIKNAIFRVFTTGRGAVGQGSTFGNLYTHPEVLAKTEELAPVHDIDFVKGNAISESNPILAKIQDRQSRALASTAQSAVEKEQGIREQPGVGFHATGSNEDVRDILGNPTTTKSKRGGFFVMNTASAISQFGNKILRVEFNPNDVLFYKNIPKSDRLSLIPKDKNWLTYQENVIAYGKAKGYNIVEKPYYNTKSGAGTNPNAPIREIIFINEDSLKSIKSIDLLPEMQLTEVRGNKIYGVANKEKLVEFITKSDTDNEIGSAMKPTGSLLGKAINFKVYKTAIEGSNIKGPHYGGQHAEETGLSQILAFQTSDTIKEQGLVSDRSFSDLGSKFFVGPKLFGQGKELVRTLGKFETKAKEFQSNPRTKETGDRMMVLIKEQKEYYGKLYGVDFNKPVSGSDFGRASSYYKGPSKISTVVNNVSGPTATVLLYDKNPNINQNLGSKETFSSNILQSRASKIKSSATSSKSKSSSIISGKSQVSEKSSLLGKSGVSFKSALSSTSKLSPASSKSGLSSKSSTFSSKSSKSSLSSKSGLSDKSGFSSKSSFSAFSGTSSPSGPSGPSGPSSHSSRSSGGSSLSGSSGMSGGSALTGGSGILGGPPGKISIISFGNLGKRRRNKIKEGPTALINLRVNNIFASSFNINPKRRYEF